MSPNKQEIEEYSFKSYFLPITSVKAIHILFIVGIVMLCNGLFNNFIGDDNSLIVNNPAIHSLQNVFKFFLENKFASEERTLLGALYYKPILDTSFAVTYAFFGLNTFAYHFFQVSIYILNACLVYFLLKHFLSKAIALFLALIFLTHPMNSEVALYISDTQEVLFFFFGMIALLLLTKFQSKKMLFTVAILLLCSVLSKEAGILFFGISLIYVILYKRQRILPFISFWIGALLLYALLRINAIGFFPDSIAVAPIERLNLNERLIHIPAIILYYLRTFFLPFEPTGPNQWVFMQIDFFNFYLPLLIDVIFFIICVASGIWLYRKRPRKYFILFLFFMLWLVIGLALHLQIIALDQTVADRWFYFPMIGMLGMTGVLASVFQRYLNNKWIIGITIIYITTLAISTFMNTFDYKSGFTLANSKRSEARSYNDEYIISKHYYDIGDLQKAKYHAERSIALFPYITNYTNLGAIYSRMGNYKKADESYVNAMKYGEDSLPYINKAALGVVYGNPKENINFLRNTALKKYPKKGELWFYLAVLEYIHGNKQDAKLAIEKAKALLNSNDISFVYSAIINNKHLETKSKSGEIFFYSY